MTQSLYGTQKELCSYNESLIVSNMTYNAQEIRTLSAYIEALNMKLSTLQSDYQKEMLLR